MTSPRRSGIFLRSLLASCCLLVAIALALRPAPAHAQAQRTVPGNDYLLVMNAYFDGDFNTARKGFNSCAQGGIRGVDGRWIDSICYHTMIGESYYNLGDRAQALDQYTSSLQMFLAYRTWLLQVTFPEIINEASAPKVGNITWGRSTRTTLIAGLPDSMLSAQGRLDNSAVVQRGGVVAPPQYMPVRVLEVLRCTALAIARRREIMGPVCEYDPLTNQVLDALARRPAPPNHWSQAFVSVQLGLAYSAAGKRAEAVAELGKGLQVANRYDHPLTPIALLELGKLAFAEGKFDVAATMFYEATFPAVAFGQHDMLEEAFRWGQLTHIVSNQPGVYQPLVSAQTWARTQGSQVTQASLAILTAECLSNANDPADAAKMLALASRAMAGQEMQAGQIGARFNYETARVAFATGKFAAGNTALATCMAFQKGGSRRLYQIALADRLYTTGEIRVDRVAELLYDEVLREPKASDWAVDPMETMTVAMVPHLGPMEHWFEVCVKRKQPEKAAEVADLIRRHRFYSTMPTGGRLLALRWILEAPETMLADNVKLQRRDLLAKYPKLAELSKLATDLQAKISALPRVPADDKAAKEQAELFAQLANVSGLQEVLLSDIALRRDPSEFVFPPVTSVKDLQQRLKPGQAVLAYFTTARYVVGFAIGKESCKMWQISPADTTKFKQEFGSILKAWGMTDKNALVATAELRKPEWKAASTKILTALTNGAKAEHFDNLQELIIVPDGLLWYVPFEAMQLEEDGATVPLISKLRVRYAPTLGLALPDNRALPRPAQSMIVAGRMYTKEDPAVAPDAAAAIAKVLPGSFVAPAQLTAFGNTYVSTIDRLIVLDDIDDAEQGPFAWSPTRRDAGKPGGALSNWPGLPWAGPQQVIVPGYHTPVENGLKKGGAAAGDDVFLSVMGLMASGSRTVLISRWRTGGQSTYDLMREFVQELPHTSAANAWQRAVQLVTATDLDLPRELRVRSTADETLSADHPFFWAGFLLVDTGAEPPAE
jgi:tetratricopeptide (TPR) repeat protein